MRIVVLDTETTGLKPEEGHRVIEVGAVELIGRRPSGRRLHYYLNPEREVDPGAFEVHGLSYERLRNEPRFQEIADELLNFLKDSELVIHNAAFDIGFLNHELALLKSPIRIEISATGSDSLCQVIDSLRLARELHPGQRNSLDALCQRYGVSNKHRHFHGALLDAELLAEVYVLMTRGQNDLGIVEQQGQGELRPLADILSAGSLLNAVVHEQEAVAHQQYMSDLQKRMRSAPDLGENTVMLALFRDNSRYELQDHEVLKVLAYSDFHPCSQASSASEVSGLGFALGLPVLAHEPEWLIDPSRAGDALHLKGEANHLVLLKWGNGDVMQAVVADDLDWRPSAKLAPGDL